MLCYPPKTVPKIKGSITGKRKLKKTPVLLLNQLFNIIRTSVAKAFMRDHLSQ
jgi:hypothetical protein